MTCEQVEYYIAHAEQCDECMKQNSDTATDYIIAFLRGAIAGAVVAVVIALVSHK
jgi:hypothetical protein